MYNKYYYPISSTSLALIFSQACILPVRLYSKEERIPDIQNRYEDFILLTDKFGCSQCDCCLQIILTDEEAESLIDVKGGFFFYEEAIPISRIQKIFFAKQAQAKTTTSNINMSTAFIPQHIIDDKDNVFVDTNIDNVVKPKDLGNNINIDSIRSSYDTYNRVLGALALMRTAHAEGCNFSPLYIDTLSKFNSNIERQKREFAPIKCKFYSFLDKPLPLLKENIDFTILEQEAKKHHQTIIKNKITGIIDPSNLNDLVYLCYVLYYYGVADESRRKRIDELILNNFVGLKQGKEEYCAFYYGYNRGYAVFNNQYKIENKVEKVKYQLNSILDYYTIESIFEYCFNHVVSSNLTILDNWLNKIFKPALNKKLRHGEYVILDTVIRDKKKLILFSEEWWKDCLASLFPKDSINFLGYDLSSIITQKILKPFANLLKEEIGDEYNEKISLKETTIKDLEAKIQDYSHHIEVLRDQLEHCETTSQNKNLNEAQDQNIDATLQDVSIAQAQQDTKKQQEFIEKAIDLSLLKISELKKYAKELGCTIKREDSHKSIILKILKAEDKNTPKLL